MKYHAGYCLKLRHELLLIPIEGRLVRYSTTPTFSSSAPAAWITAVSLVRLECRTADLGIKKPIGKRA